MQCLGWSLGGSLAWAPGMWLQLQCSLAGSQDVFSPGEGSCVVCVGPSAQLQPCLWEAPWISLFHHDQVTWALSGLSWLRGHPRKELSLCLQQQGKDRALGPALAWPGAAGAHPGVQRASHSIGLAPAALQAPRALPAPSMQEPWLLELSGSWNCIAQGMAEAGAAVLPPVGLTKEPPPALLTFRNGCAEEEDLERGFPSCPALGWLDRGDISLGMRLSVLGGHIVAQPGCS